MARTLESSRQNRARRLGSFVTQQWFKFAQRLSQALLIPIAILPAAGVMLGLTVSPIPFMPEELTVLMLAVGKLIFAIMPMLFAVAVAIGFCRDQGIAAFTAVFGYGVMTATLAALADLYRLPTQPLLGMDTLDTGIAGGMMLGGITCLAVRWSQYIRLPAIFSFFEGRRSASLLIIPLAMGLGYVLAHVWPPLALLIERVSDWAVYQKPAIAFGVYGALERLLIPLGLHHIWNAPFYLEVGQYQLLGHEVVRGEVARYLAGDPQAGNLAGGYLIKMWGLPAAALAMWRCADPSERNRVAGIMLSAGAASWLTGVTEPIEFAFMFVAPILFIIHALLTGLAYFVCIMLDIHHSIVFSQGLVDFTLLFPLSRNASWFIFLGPLTAIIYYLLFRLSILAFNLKTPGRLEHNDRDSKGPKESLRAIIAALGGRDNIVELNACLTRLRLSVHKPELVNKVRLSQLGAKGVIVMGKGVQVVYGTKAETLRKVLQRYLDTRR
ncbi:MULTISPECIES: PTS transporter subunit EIIC [Shewanella]|uniref:PTS transporter subunit EIIC n=1 Tax=Shewanella TaxID=22 RepID=UPI001CF3005D|nr:MULTISPECIES: PTS transporter subunit EIIC [Shewanella]MCB2381562.1 PTS transporter subunit EIIC [Shewanella sp. SR1]MCS6191047.1 PTS transporter subunit EIIC [Shewanella baltica]MCS6209663.1 PTS transporter subunit EIIC [Shewanella baltica]MCS6231230.1 PTS transporter subunit EIIC [Shewanella baltica]MCS6259660.1 PTS transporter subunit EIIC [Shewanella baltica]